MKEIKNYDALLDMLSSVGKKRRQWGTEDAYKSIEERREEIYQEAIKRGYFTQEEFDAKFRGEFIDKYGQDSLACYISCAFEKPDGVFVTVNPKMLKRKMQLQLRFETKIISIEDAGLQRRGQVLMLDASLLTEILVEEQVQKSAKLAAEGKYTVAIEEANVGLALDEFNIKLLTIRGTSYASTEQMEEAKVDLELVYEADPDCPPELIHNLGCVYCATEEYEKAREFFQQALRMRPDYELPQKMLEQLDKEEKQKKAEAGKSGD
jgi:tetratricopeptide (TPR) repeat protein